MKRYTVNVHYDAVLTVVVDAETEDQAIDLAVEESESMSLNDGDAFYHDACITNEEDV